MIVKLPKWMDFQNENQIHQAIWSQCRLKFSKLDAKTFSVDRQQLKKTCEKEEKERARDRISITIVIC
jgi:hypothetical protein